MSDNIQYLQSVIIIPAYQPNETLIRLIEELKHQDEGLPFIVVNDGSSEACDPVFAKLANYPNVTVLRHAVNLGKGQALKTAFNHYLLHAHPASPGVITADADGQHSAGDICKMVAALNKQSSVFWLGSRQTKAKVPFRSRFGNSVTRKIFQLIIGKSIYDTQTGLRAIPKSLLPDLLRLPSSRYEYELDMLVNVINKKVEVKEVPIETIYLDGNKSSHFNPILDSLKIYFVFVRYLGASISSAIIDFLGFILFYWISKELFASLALARIISGTFNFLLCKNVIFKSGAGMLGESIKYVSLAIFSLMLSYVLVLGLVNDYHIDLYFSKILADVFVFIINFAVQKALVFSSGMVREKQ